jgi:cytidine deaminase
MSKDAGMRSEPLGQPYLSAATMLARAGGRSPTPDDVLLELLPWAAAFARPAISEFAVGAVALGLSGAVYAGANLEFPGASLSFTVHAEQAAVYNAWKGGELGVTLVATTAPPCGFCRQFLNELDTAGELRVLVAGRRPATLPDLLPEAFGPRDLGAPAGFMRPARRALTLAEFTLGRPVPSAATAAALDGACAAYAPYTETSAGVGLHTTDGPVYEGRYVENAAFNPSLGPLQAALILLALAGGDTRTIDEAVLVETHPPATGRPSRYASQRTATAALLATVAPNVPLQYLRADERRNAATMQA